MSDSDLRKKTELTNIGRFLTRLAIDGDLCRDYERDPERALSSQDLTSEERKILLSGDWSRIRQSICPDPTPANVIVRTGDD